MPSPPSAWYKKHHPLGYALSPVAWLFCSIAFLRRLAYRRGLFPVHHPGIPLVVVGNITTGGTGKTPLVIRLAALFQENGFRPGIVLRGYGGKPKSKPRWVDGNTDPALAGDEAVLLAHRTGCPVVAAPNRVTAALELIAHTDCDLILSDDGLQHYALGRDVEIAVVDGKRGYGNGRCLPAGPLREPVSRLATVDFVMINRGTTREDDRKNSHLITCRHGDDKFGLSSPCYDMTLTPGVPRQVMAGGRSRPIKEFVKTTVHAVCGIGNPERFFYTLRGFGLRIIPHKFPDHHPFRAEDLAFGDDLPILMTEKDAVKCRQFAEPRYWCLPVEATLDATFGARLLGTVRGVSASAPSTDISAT